MEAGTSLKIRLFSAAAVLMCGGAASFAYSAFWDESLMVHASLFSVAALSGLFLLWTIHSQLMLPLRTIRNYARGVANGSSAACPLDSMPREYSDLRDSICAMVESLAKALDDAQRKGDEAQRLAADSNKALQESREAEAQIRKLLNDMNTASQKAANASASIFAGVRELGQNMENVDNDVIMQRERMREASQAIEQINTAIQDIAHNTGKAAEDAEMARSGAVTGAQGVRAAVTSIDQVKGRILSLKETMTSLGQQAEGIGAVVGVITDIADQTNLLALNAAIEAARAGDAGRGFAVVADEVRKLAEKTMTATQEVGQAVQGIQEGTKKNIQNVDNAGSAIEEAANISVTSGESLSKILDLVNLVNDQVQSIATASEQQSAASEEINRSVEQVASISEETAQAMEHASRAVADLAQQSQVLQGLITDMKSAA